MEHNFYYHPLSFILGAILISIMLIGLMIYVTVILIHRYQHIRTCGYNKSIDEQSLFRNAVFMAILGYIGAFYLISTMYTTLNHLNNIQNNVVDAIHESIVSGKSNKYISAKPYKKVVAIEKNNKLLSIIKTNNTSVNKKHRKKIFMPFTTDCPNILVKYNDHTQESFDIDKASIISKASYKKKPLEINVYNMKLTNLGKKYIRPDNYYLGNTRKIVITSYVKLKSINWQKVN